MRLERPNRTVLILAGLTFLLGSMFSSQGLAYQSLQQVYNAAGPGGGYDKLLELNPAVEYGGDLNIPSGVTVGIHGNGAKIFGLSSPVCCIRVYGSGLDVGHCIFIGGEPGSQGIYFDSNSYGEVTNNTIVGFADAGIKCYYYNVSQGLRVENNIVLWCTYGVYAEENYEPTYIAYNDFWSNGYNYAHYCPGWPGLEPFSPTPGTGEIHADPLFRNPSENDYRLGIGSPCIDAGNPAYPYNPDGTVADMGALFFYHVAAVSILPKNPPIIIRPGGGTFRFEATITNTSDMTVDIYAWTMAYVPEIGEYGPILERQLHLTPHQTIYLPNVPQEVPGMAPAGTYYYMGFVGFYPERMDSSSFAFFKTGKSAGGRWSTGDWFEQTAELNLPVTASLLGNYPNPFNSSTTINYELSYRAEVKLEVFSLLGEKVATLVDGWQEAGYKSASWEASDLSSGVYFCKLTVGNYSNTRSMLFIK